MFTYSNGQTTSVLDLQEAIQEYILTETNFIGQKLLPILPVPHISGILKVHTKEGMLKLNDNKRAANGAYPEIDNTYKEVSYRCLDRGNTAFVDDGAYKDNLSYFAADLDAMQALISNILRNYESRVAAKVFNTATFAGTDYYLDTAKAWSSSTIGEILKDFTTAVNKISTKTGRVPNACALSYNTLMTIATVASWIDTNAYAGRDATIAVDRVADQLSTKTGLQVFVGQEHYDAKPEGVATGTTTSIWSDSYCFVGRVANDGTGPRDSGLGRTMVFAPDMGSGLYTIDPSWRDENRRGTLWRVRHTVGEEVLDKNNGFLMKID